MNAGGGDACVHMHAAANVNYHPQLLFTLVFGDRISH